MAPHSIPWARVYKDSTLVCRQYRTARPVVAQAWRAEEAITALTPSSGALSDVWLYATAGSDMGVSHCTDPRRVCELVGSSARVTATVALGRGGLASAGADKLIRYVEGGVREQTPPSTCGPG